MFTSENTLPAVKQSSIPLLRQTVSCGPGQDWQDADNIESYIEPLSLAAHGKELYAFRSRGISMVGTGIQDGDILIFDGAKDQQLQDDIYVFGYNGEAFCKFLRFDIFSGKIHIYSVHNKDLDKAELLRTLDSGTEGFQIFGRVLGRLIPARKASRYSAESSAGYMRTDSCGDKKSPGSPGQSAKEKLEVTQ